MGSFWLFLISLLYVGSPVGDTSTVFPEFPSLELDGAMRSSVNVPQAQGSSSCLLVTVSASCPLLKPSCTFMLKESVVEKVWPFKTPSLKWTVTPQFSIIYYWATKHIKTPQAQSKRKTHIQATDIPTFNSQKARLNVLPLKIHSFVFRVWFFEKFTSHRKQWTKEYTAMVSGPLC